MATIKKPTDKEVLSNSRMISEDAAPQTKTQEAGSSGGFTNFQQYATANKPQAGVMGQNIVGNVQKKAQDIKSQTQAKYDQFGRIIGSEEERLGKSGQTIETAMNAAPKLISPNEAAMQNVAQITTPTDRPGLEAKPAPTIIPSAPELTDQQLKSFQQLLAGDYKRDIAAPDLSAQQAALQQQKNLGKNINTNVGRLQALSNVYKSPTYTAGQKGLDAFLIGDKDVSRAVTSGVRGAVGDDPVSKARQEALTRLTNLGNAARQSAIEAESAVAGKEKALTDDLVKRQEAAKVYTDAVNALKAGTPLTDAQKAALNIGTDTRTYGLDLPGLTSGNTFADISGLGKEQYANMSDLELSNYLAKLRGQDTGLLAKEQVGVAEKAQQDSLGRFQAELEKQKADYLKQYTPQTENLKRMEEFSPLLEENVNITKQIQDLQKSLVDNANADPWIVPRYTEAEKEQIQNQITQLENRNKQLNEQMTPYLSQNINPVFSFPELLGIYNPEVSPYLPGILANKIKAQREALQSLEKKYSGNF